MIQADMEVLHSIKGRMRIRLRNGLQYPEGAVKVLKGNGITAIDYNDYTRTCVVYYENTKPERVLSKIAVYYATKSEMEYVHIRLGYKEMASLNSLQTVSLLAVVADVSLRVFLPGSMLSSATSACAALATIGAIFGNSDEGDVKNNKQLKYMSSMLKSVLGKNSTLTTATAWVSEFGEHFYWNEQRDTMLKIDRRFDPETQSTCYDVKQVSVAQKEVKRHIAREIWGTYIQARYRY